MWILVFQRILLDILIDIIYFPVWWYSRGILYWTGRVLEFFKSGNSFLAPGLWLKNIFVPMFGQYDWEGRIISFFMRLFQVIVRGIALFGWLLVCIVVFLIWIILPIYIVLGFFN